MPIVEAARKINCRQRDRVVEKLLHELKILKGRTIGLLGLAFKPNTDDLREAPAIEIAQKLIDRGVRVKAHDPIALERFQREHGAYGRPSLQERLRSGRGLRRAGASHRMERISGSGLGSARQEDAHIRFFWTDATHSIGRN